jgi:hypothetical protein
MIRERTGLPLAPSDVGFGAVKRRAWTAGLERELKNHSRALTPVTKIAKHTRRTEGMLRQKALHLGIGLGHRR